MLRRRRGASEGEGLEVAEEGDGARLAEELLVDEAAEGENGEAAVLDLLELEHLERGGVLACREQCYITCYITY